MSRFSMWLPRQSKSSIPVWYRFFLQTHDVGTTLNRSLSSIVCFRYYSRRGELTFSFRHAFRISGFRSTLVVTLTSIPCLGVTLFSFILQNGLLSGGLIAGFEASITQSRSERTVLSCCQHCINSYIIHDFTNQSDDEGLSSRRPPRTCQMV